MCLKYGLMNTTDTFEALQNPQDTRTQILNAAMICIMSVGPARTNISSVAAQAGVSRPTVYAHFERLDDLIQEAVSQGTSILLDVLKAHARQFSTPRERVSKTFLRLLDLADQVDVLRKPMSFEIGTSDRDRIPEEAIVAARQVLDEMLGDQVKDDKLANERAETGVRFFLSLAAYRKTEDVEGYVDRVVLPALGL